MTAVEFSRVHEKNDWTSKAACRGLTTLLLPAVGRTAAGTRSPRSARPLGVRVLRRSARPAASTPASNHEYGFWGGESEDERHAAGFRLIAPIGTRARSSVAS